MSRPTDTTTAVSAEDVRTARFPLIRRGGYDPRQVDPFLEAVAQRLEGGMHADPAIDASAVHNARFATVRRGGYSPAEVDAFLDRVIDTLDPTQAHHVADWPAEDAPSGPRKAVTQSEANALWDAGVEDEIEILDDAPPPDVDLVDLPHLETERVNVGAGQTDSLLDGDAVPDAAAPPPPPPPPSPAPVADPEPEPVIDLQAHGAPVDALAVGQANLDRLRELYDGGILTDNELTVLAERAKRRAREAHQAATSS